MPSRERQWPPLHSQLPPHGMPSVLRRQVPVSFALRVPLHVPPEHTGSLHERVCVPDVSHPNPRQRPHAPQVRAPHVLPSVVRVPQLCICVNAVPSPHAPSTHTRGRQVRVWVPEREHGDAYEHALHEPQTGVLPQLEPSVLREQAWDSENERAVQVPPWHSLAVQLRVCVPLSPQGPENPVHAPNEPQVAAAHASPSVLRVQARVSVPSEGTHAPDAHVKVRTVRDWLPPSAHWLAYSQAPHAP